MSDANRREDRRERALALAQKRRELMALSPRRRMDALLEAKDARGLVRSLPVADLYTTIQELGLPDAPELVQLASPAQFQSFLDLGAWSKDGLDAHRALTWLRAARGEEDEEFLAKVRKMDLEVLELLLRRFTRVYNLEEEPDVNPEGVTMETPEGRYLVEFTVEGPELAAMRSLVNDLIAQNPFEAVRLFEAVRWEVPGELEETAWRFRTARLSDLGFPPLDEALSLFAFQDPAKFPVRGHAAGVALARHEPRVDYLEAALRALEPDEVEGAEMELRLVSNQALMAEGAEPGDLDAQRRTLEMVRDVLNLGLEHATGGDAERAVDVLREEHLKRIFQLGFSLTLRLKFRADRLLAQPLAKPGDTVLLMPREAEAVAALRRKRPRRVLKVEGAEPVPFRSRRELAESEAVLARAEAQVTLFGALLGGTPAEAQQALAALGEGREEGAGAEDVLAAALARALLTAEARALPLARHEVEPLLRALFSGTPEAPEVRPEARTRALAVLEPALPEAARVELRRLVDETLARWQEELAPAFLSGQPLDEVAEVLLPLAPAGRGPG